LVGAGQGSLGEGWGKMEMWGGEGWGNRGLRGFGGSRGLGGERSEWGG
jgi:hypothetical protein